MDAIDIHMLRSPAPCAPCFSFFIDCHPHPLLITSISFVVPSLLSWGLKAHPLPENHYTPPITRFASRLLLSVYCIIIDYLCVPH